MNGLLINENRIDVMLFNDHMLKVAQELYDFVSRHNDIDNLEIYITDKGGRFRALWFLEVFIEIGRFNNNEQNIIYIITGNRIERRILGE